MQCGPIEYVYAVYMRERLVAIVSHKDFAKNAVNSKAATRFEEYTLDKVQGYETSPISSRR